MPTSNLLRILTSVLVYWLPSSRSYSPVAEVLSSPIAICFWYQLFRYYISEVSISNSLAAAYSLIWYASQEYGVHNKCRDMLSEVGREYMGA